MTTEPAEQKILQGIFHSEGKQKHPKRSQGISNVKLGKQKAFEKTSQKVENNRKYYVPFNNNPEY